METDGFQLVQTKKRSRKSRGVTNNNDNISPSKDKREVSHFAYNTATTTTTTSTTTRDNSQTEEETLSSLFSKITDIQTQLSTTDFFNTVTGSCSPLHTPHTHTHFSHILKTIFSFIFPSVELLLEKLVRNDSKKGREKEEEEEESGVDVVCYGLGSFLENRRSQFQLAFLLLFLKRLRERKGGRGRRRRRRRGQGGRKEEKEKEEGECFVFDPVFNSVEKTLLESRFALKNIPTNEVTPPSLSLSLSLSNPALLV
jgi:hypothetical protein